MIFLGAGMGLQGVILIYATPHRCMPGLKSIRFDEFVFFLFFDYISKKSYFLI